MMTQETMNGRDNKRSDFFLPILFATAPAGSAPKRAPMAKNDPIHACSDVVGCKPRLSSFGIPGDVQARAVPTPTERTQART